MSTRTNSTRKDLTYKLKVSIETKAVERLVERAVALEKELEQTKERLASAEAERDRLLQDLLLASVQVGRG